MSGTLSRRVTVSDCFITQHRWSATRFKLGLWERSGCARNVVIQYNICSCFGRGNITIIRIQNISEKRLICSFTISPNLYTIGFLATDKDWRIVSLTSEQLLCSIFSLIIVVLSPSRQMKKTKSQMKSVARRSSFYNIRIPDSFLHYSGNEIP